MPASCPELALSPSVENGFRAAYRRYLDNIDKVGQ